MTDTRPPVHGLQYDPSEAEAFLSRADERLRALIERVGPCRLEGRGLVHPFRTLLWSIVYQQLSGKAAATIHGRVLRLLPEDTDEQPKALLHLPQEELRAAGLSRAKTLAVKDLAVRTLQGEVPDAGALQRLSDDEIIRRLVQIRGVGRWTVEMLLIFHLGRPDVLPVHDLGVRKGYMQLYHTQELPTPVELGAAGERWRPYRSVASWYLWRALDLD